MNEVPKSNFGEFEPENLPLDHSLPVVNKVPESSFGEFESQNLPLEWGKLLVLRIVSDLRRGDGRYLLDQSLPVVSDPRVH